MGWGFYTSVVAGLLGAASPAAQVRILVFPHVQKLTDPQGRDTRIDEVTLKTPGICTATSSKGKVVQRGPELTFRFASLPAPLTVKCTEPPTVVRPAPLGSYRYAGSFVVQRAKSRAPEVQVINYLTLEDYLAGVLPAEMEQDWPLEALKAQAVAARTYAAWEIGRARHSMPHDPGYDLDDTVQFQAYSGLPTNPLPSTARALEQTKGKLLTTANGAPIRAYFHADSGGHTEDAANGILIDIPAPYCVGKAEVYDERQAPPPWEKRVPLAEAQAKLEAEHLLPAGETLTGAEVDEATRFPSGRAKTVLLSRSAGAAVVPPLAISAIDLRFALELRSTLFHVKVEGSDLVFDGRGSGHGVGMSQWGAKLLSDQLHWDYSKILLFYYTDVKLCEHCSW
jgi:stage II sporulation protein D